MQTPPSRLVPVLLCLLLAALSRPAAACYKALSPSDFPECVDLSDAYALHFAVANGTLRVGVEVAMQKPSWVGFGLSETGGMKGADIVVVESLSDGSLQATDMHALGNETPRPDVDQNARLLSASFADGLLVAAFARPLAPCDEDEDLAVQPGVPVTVIWAVGTTPRLTYHGATRGARSIVLDPLPACGEEEGGAAAGAAAAANCSRVGSAAGAVPSEFAPVAGASLLQLRMPNVTVPTAETTYVCRLIRMPSEQRYHVTGYRGISSPTLHHMVLYRCPSSGPAGIGAEYPPSAARTGASGEQYGEAFDCTPYAGGVCTEYVATWAPGAGVTIMPPDAGLPFGEGEDVLFMLEAHYNNPDGVAGQVDSSGFELQYTPNLRPHDMGVLTLGTFDIDVPPGRERFSPPPNLCPAECTNKIAGGGGLHVVSSFLHMHMAGAAINTRQLREEQELSPLGRIKNFDFNFNTPQWSDGGNRRILGGDGLITTCTYNTVGRANRTYMGLGSRDEMCYVYVSYWPRHPNISACIALPSTPAGNLTLCGQETQADELFESADLATAAARGVEEGWLLVGPKAGPYKPYAEQCSDDIDADAEGADSLRSVDSSAAEGQQQQQQQQQSTASPAGAPAAPTSGAAKTATEGAAAAVSLAVVGFCLAAAGLL